MALKACFIDVTHWHAPHYYKTLKQVADLAAISARNPQTGRGVAASLGCRFYADWREMVQKDHSAEDLTVIPYKPDAQRKKRSDALLGSLRRIETK